MAALADPTFETKPLSLDGVRVLVLFGGDRLFGSELGNLEVFRQMSTLGLKVRFITRKNCGHLEIQPQLDRLGFEWTTAPFGYHWGRYLFGKYFYYLIFNIYGVIATNWRLWREVRNWKPTHLYCMNWVFFTYSMPMILWLRLPLIYRAGDDLPMHTSFHRWIVHKLIKRIELMVCISKYIMQRCVLAGMVSDRIRVIYNYPPTRGKAPSVNLPAVSPGSLIVTYVGQVSKPKGLSVLLDAVELLVARGDDLILWIAGDASHDNGFLPELKERVKRSGLNSRVLFFGYVPNVFSILDRTDIHVCPSLFDEPLSNVVGEAKLSSKPSVVFPKGGLPELIEHKVDGYVCEEASAEALVTGITYFSRDAKKRIAAGVAARRSLDTKFGLEGFRGQWSAVFSSSTSIVP